MPKSILNKDRCTKTLLLATKTSGSIKAVISGDARCGADILRG